MNEEEFNERERLEKEINKKEQTSTMAAKLTAVMSALTYVVAALAVQLGFIQLSLRLDFTTIPVVDNALLVLSVFALSIVFYGYLGMIALGIIGLGQGNVIQGNLALLVHVIPLALACYAGARVGTFIQADLQGKENILTGWKTTLIILAIAILLAIVLAFTQGQLPVISLPVPQA